MPRIIDFSKGNETDWNEVRLPEPRYGDREIRREELDAMVEAFRSLVGGFEPQFSTYGKTIEREQRERVFDAAHAWLSENATGPWHWTEHWTNHGHHLDVAVYVERVPDQLAFATAHDHLFGYSATEDLSRLAVERGALPPLTTKESFSKWVQEHDGFDFLKADDLGERGIRIVFSHAELEARFKDAWADKFVAREKDGRTVYEGSEEGLRWDKTPSIWLTRNGGVSSISGGGTPDDYRWSVVARYPDVAEALARDWGHAFTPAEDGRTFSAKSYPSSPTREIPADFVAYIKGEREDYDAPHLPEELKPFREAASSAPGMR